MSDYNPNSPLVRGSEFLPESIRNFAFDSPGKGLAIRFKSGGAVIDDRVDLYLASKLGTPGLGIEILDTLEPTTTTLVVKPGTNTGATTTNWQNEAAGAVGFTDVTTQYDGHFAQFAGSVGTVTTQDLLYRGDASALSGKRIAGVSFTAQIYNDQFVSPRWQFAVKLGGVVYPVGTVHANNPSYGAKYPYPGETIVSGTVALNPATGLPWTMAEINLLITTAGTDSWGLRITTPANSSVSGPAVDFMSMSVDHVPDNRKGFIYATTIPESLPLWIERTLGGLAAQTANTYYWLHIFNVGANANAGNYFTIPILKDSGDTATVLATDTGEHRQVYETTIMGTGIITDAVVSPGELAPFLLQRQTTNTIETQSNSYVDLVSSNLGVGVTSAGGEITADGSGTTYGAVKMVVGWAGTMQPDRPLKIEVRSTGAAPGSALVGTAYLQPSDVPTAAFRKLLAFLDVTFVSSAIQYFITCTSEAASTRRWAIGVGSTRSDVLGSGVAIGDVEGASQGGQTDSHFHLGGIENDGYDLLASLFRQGVAPASFVATPQAAV